MPREHIQLQKGSFSPFKVTGLMLCNSFVGAVDILLLFF